MGLIWMYKRVHCATLYHELVQMMKSPAEFTKTLSLSQRCETRCSVSLCQALAAKLPEGLCINPANDVGRSNPKPQP